MASSAQPPAASERELVLDRILDCPRELAWRCWTEPALLVKWFTPAPWSTVRADIDLRPGGSSLVVMRSPEGQEYPNPGVYLEVEPGKRLVFTDAFTSAWVPSEKPFMVATVTFEDAGPGQTHYTAVARHWTKEDRERHEQMGFHAGWNAAADQLVALAKALA